MMAVMAGFMVLAVSGCEAGAEATPTRMPADEILFRSEEAMRNVDSYEFDSEIVIATADGETPEWLPVLSRVEGQENASGNIIGEWERDTGWAVTFTGFDLGTGVLNSASAASDGTNIVFREDPDSPWRQVRSIPLPPPAPENWFYVYDLEGLALRSGELTVNEEPVWRFSTTREAISANNAGAIFGDLPGLSGNVSVAYDLFISQEDFEVRSLVALISTTSSSMDITWNFDNHNSAEFQELPDELEDAAG